MIGGSPVHLMWSGMFNPETPVRNRAVDWRRIVALFVPYWRQEVTVLVCIVFVAALGLSPPLFTKHLIDVALPRLDVRQICIDVGGMIAAAVVAAVIGVYQGYLNSFVGEAIMRDIRTKLVSHLHRMPISFFTNTKTGEIMNRVSIGVDNIDNVATGTLVSLATT